MALWTEPKSEIVYKCSDYYVPELEGTLLWNDPEIGINWPLDKNPILSDKDSRSLSLADFESPFIFGDNS